PDGRRPLSHETAAVIVTELRSARESKQSRIDQRQRADAGTSREQGGAKFIGIVPKRGNHPYAGDDDPFHGGQESILEASPDGISSSSTPMSSRMLPPCCRHSSGISM